MTTAYLLVDVRVAEGWTLWNVFGLVLLIGAAIAIGVVVFISVVWRK